MSKSFSIPSLKKIFSSRKNHRPYLVRKPKPYIFGKGKTKQAQSLNSFLKGNIFDYLQKSKKNIEEEDLKNKIRKKLETKYSRKEMNLYKEELNLVSHKKKKLIQIFTKKLLSFPSRKFSNSNKTNIDIRTEALKTYDELIKLYTNPHEIIKNHYSSGKQLLELIHENRKQRKEKYQEELLKKLTRNREQYNQAANYRKKLENFREKIALKEIISEDILIQILNGTLSNKLNNNPYFKREINTKLLTKTTRYVEEYIKEKLSKLKKNIDEGHQSDNSFPLFQKLKSSVNTINNLEIKTLISVIESRRKLINNLKLIQKKIETSKPLTKQEVKILSNSSSNKNLKWGPNNSSDKLFKRLQLIQSNFILKNKHMDKYDKKQINRIKEKIGYIVRHELILNKRRFPMRNQSGRLIIEEHKYVNAVDLGLTNSTAGGGRKTLRSKKKIRKVSRHQRLHKKNEKYKRKTNKSKKKY
jgi:hypothetical protein